MTNAERRRLVAWRFKVLQQATVVPRNVARTCRHFGISRKTYYKWKHRFDDHREAGLCDRPRIPHRVPRATPSDVISKIVYLRQTYHFGPRRIRDYLNRFHRVSVATSTVHRILVKHGMQRLPAHQKHRSPAARWIRYEKPQPGHRLQLDVKFLERIPGTQKRLYQFTAIDDCTRIRVLKVHDACNQRTAIQFIDEVRRRLPFRVLAIQTDNGAEFQSQFHWHVESLDIRHVYIRPRTPHLNGKVERSHRVDDEEFYQLLDEKGITDDIHLFNEKLREWEGPRTPHLNGKVERSHRVDDEEFYQLLDEKGIPPCPTPRSAAKKRGHLGASTWYWPNSTAFKMKSTGSKSELPSCKRPFHTSKAQRPPKLT